MNLLTPAESIDAYSEAGVRKTRSPALRLFLLALLAGLMIAFGSAVAAAASHAVANASAARIVSGLLFPFGLGMVILTGAELFTGNCLLAMPLLSGRISAAAMLRNLAIVYLGNFAGALLLAAGCVFSGQMELSAGALAVHTIRTAAAKCALPFGSAVVLGVLCNLLVCLAVVCSLCAKDAAGRVIGAYLPVSFFVICGFEHCVANMYCIPAGLFAQMIPRYAAQAAAAGVDASMLTWGNFLLNNLLPVTLGNVLGGVALASLLWYCHGERPACRQYRTDNP